MKAGPEITIRRLTPELLGDYLAFFDGPAFADNPGWSDCYCLFPYTDGDDDAFEARPAAAKRVDISEAIRAGRAEGYLAYHGGRVVGWLNAEPRERYPQLTELPADGARIGVTSCFTIDPAWRRRGLARRLLAAAMDGLREDGMTHLQAGPETEPRDDAHRYRGTIELYESAGYESVAQLPGGRTLMEKEL